MIHRPRTHRLLTVLVTASVAVAGLLGVTAAPASAAVNASAFDPGNLISDANFFNGGAMTAADIQAFLNGKVPTCRVGYTCLKAYTETTPTKAAVSTCTSYTGAANESAAAIIAKVGAACNVSQKVLLVLLEKEQSLVSDTWPEAGQYRSATGYGCPDTAACSTLYYGFFNQLWNAAVQFKRYAASPTSWNYLPGRTNTIRYSPNTACGSSAVYVQNQATAGLYNYTPYQPNAAALANMYGTGDPCSSYGNRNFWRIYSDWFGNPTVNSSLLRTAANSTVYIISGTQKYPLPSVDLLTTYAPLGPVSYVTQAYLDSFTTMQNAGKIIRATSGGIFLVDGTTKLPIATCGQVIDFGGTCLPAGYVQLTDQQAAAFATGPTLSNVIGTTAGARYYVTAGIKREILDPASQAAAGLPATFPVITENAVAGLTAGAPITRDAVFVAERGTSNYWYLGNGQRYKVDPAAVTGAGAATRAAGSLWTSSLAGIPAAPNSFNGTVTVTGAPNISVLADGGQYTWGAANSATGAVTVPAAFLSSYPVKGTISNGTYIKSPTNLTVYLVTGSQARPISSMTAWTSLTSNLTVLTVPAALISAIPTGSTITIPSNTLVRTPSNATVYLINGISSKIPLTSFAMSNAAGISKAATVTQTQLDAYPTGPILGFGITCGPNSYISAAGAVHPVTAAQLPLYPISFTTLDPYECAALKIGSPATTFIRTPDGSVYQLAGGQKHPVSSMTRFNQISGGQAWLNVEPLLAAAIPTGPLA